MTSTTLTTTLAGARALSTDPLERRVVIVTGAGASRNLGASEPMPLMQDWNRLLVGELDQIQPGLAKAIGLSAGASGPEFEEAVGLFLGWVQAFQLNRKYAAVGNVEFGATHPLVNDWLKRSEEQSALVTEELWRSLYRHFRADVVDREKAQKAFARLDEALGGRRVAKKVATTNYEQSAEIGLEATGYAVTDGFSGPSWRTPVFDPSNLGTWTDSRDPVAVIHLHGAVGWYRREGTVLRHAADQDYNATLGIPVILPPDPKKDPLNDATVAGLWTEFNRSLATASHVLVLGHSLHDPALVRQLREASARRVQVLIAGLEPSNTEIPEAATVNLEFGPDMMPPVWGEKWLEIGNDAVRPPAGSRATVMGNTRKSRVVQ